MSEDRYIEAFYDYYFFLESFFGEGKTIKSLGARGI
jgi:hypothetical protein